MLVTADSVRHNVVLRAKATLDGALAALADAELLKSAVEEHLKVLQERTIDCAVLDRIRLRTQELEARVETFNRLKQGI